MESAAPMLMFGRTESERASKKEKERIWVGGERDIIIPRHHPLTAVRISSRMESLSTQGGEDTSQPQTQSEIQAQGGQVQRVR
jgi:hypothetical protein